jgi:hypothetical protein
MSLNYVALTFNLVDGQGNPIKTGTATLVPSSILIDTVDNAFVSPAPITVYLASNRKVTLLATDNVNLNPSSWLWNVTFDRVPGNPQIENFALLFANGATQNWSDIIPAGPGTSESSWVVGPQGTPGTPGAIGPQGPTGPQGAIGYSPMDYGAIGNGVADDTAAFQAVITAHPYETIYVPSGTYLIGSGPLTGMKNNFRMTGEYSTLITTSNGLFSFGSTTIYNMELDHLNIDVTGGDVCNGPTLVRCHFHDLSIVQRSANYAVWNAPAVSNYLENTWERIAYTLTAAARTIPAWNFVVNPINDTFNENVFEEIVASNNGLDAAQYQFWIQSNHSGYCAQNNAFRAITFEQPYGGAIRVASIHQVTIERCRIWDLATDISASLFNIATDPTSGVGPVGTSIRDCGRVGGTISGVSAQDIQLDSGCAEVLIENYYLQNPGHFYLNLGGSSGTTIINPTPSLVLSGTSGASYTQVGGAATTSYTNSSGVVSTLGGASTPAVPLTDASSVVVNASLSNYFRLTTTSAVGATRMLQNPSNATDGLSFELEIVQPSSGGPCALMFDTGYAFSASLPQSSIVLSTNPSGSDFIKFKYNSTAGKWRVLAANTGF